jgi:hypothetical protein
MKTQLIIITLLFFIPLAAISQNRGDVRIGTYAQVTSFENRLIPQYGISGEWFVADNFSLNYKYGMGTNLNGDITGHINPAIFLVAFAASYPAAILGVLMISEGVSYHIPINDFVEFAPYLNPLGAEINLYEDNSFVFSGATGVNVYFKHFTPIEHLLVSFIAGATIIYCDSNVLPTVGLTLSYDFR